MDADRGDKLSRETTEKEKEKERERERRERESRKRYFFFYFSLIHYSLVHLRGVIGLENKQQWDPDQKVKVQETEKENKKQQKKKKGNRERRWSF